MWSGGGLVLLESGTRVFFCVFGIWECLFVLLMEYLLIVDFSSCFQNVVDGWWVGGSGTRGFQSNLRAI